MKYRRNYYQIKSNDEIFEKILSEKSTVGYYDLPYQDTNSIRKYCANVKKNNIVIVGIGGSSLGVEAIFNFLESSRDFNKKLFFLNTIDPQKVNAVIRSFDSDDAHFIFVSKSGETVEIIALFHLLDKLIGIDSTNATLISEVDTSFHKLSITKDIGFFTIPKNVGGRFSVFSPAGLVPLCMMGIDIDQLLYACRKVLESFLSKKDGYDALMSKARFLVENKSRFNINVIFSYSSCLEGFNKWFVQLWAESLGKKNINGTRQALTPIGLIGPIDQHSFLQLIVDGVRDKTLTFIKIYDHKETIEIPTSYNLESDFLEDFNDMNLSFNELINLQADATIMSIEQEEDIPLDVITIKTIDEYNIAELMFTYQILVSVIGSFLQINTYNQPGVEYGKKLLKKKLKELD